jgi:hypothetical protein
LLELAPNNTILRGKLVGLGAHSEEILSGEIEIKKDKTPHNSTFAQ